VRSLWPSCPLSPKPRSSNPPSTIRSARIFLGLTEAGLFPGVTYYISLWYKRDEQSKRVAIFFSAATIAGAFGGLLAFGIEKMDGIAGLNGWAWIVCSSSCLLSMWVLRLVHSSCSKVLSQSPWPVLRISPCTMYVSSLPLPSPTFRFLTFWIVDSTQPPPDSFRLRNATSS